MCERCEVCCFDFSDADFELVGDLFDGVVARFAESVVESEDVAHQAVEVKESLREPSCAAVGEAATTSLVDGTADSSDGNTKVVEERNSSVVGVGEEAEQEMFGVNAG